MLNVGGLVDRYLRGMNNIVWRGGGKGQDVLKFEVCSKIQQVSQMFCSGLQGWYCKPGPPLER